MKDDPSYIGGDVVTFLIPAGWKVDGGVHWDMASTYPAQVGTYIYDPNGARWFGVYPSLLYYWDDRNNRLGYHPPVGSKYAGGVVEPPIEDVFKAIQQVVVPTFRKELAHARVVETEKLPKLAKFVFDHSFGLPGQMQTVTAGRMRFEYQVNGQTVQEDVTAALTLRPNPQFKVMNWNISSIISTRGVKGSLDDLKMTRLIMQRSTRFDLKWYNKLLQFSLAANRAKLAEIMATAERSRIFAQMTNEVNNRASRCLKTRSTATLDAQLAFDQYIRDVTPYNTTSGPPVELPARTVTRGREPTDSTS